MRMNTETKRNYADCDRRGSQLVRILIIIDCMKRLNYLSLTDIAWNLSRNKIVVSDRTLRRDLAVLVKLNWCNPDDHDGKTVWRWTKDR